MFDGMYEYAYHWRMEFTCNPIKNETNIRERSLPLLAAREMFTGEMLVREDTRHIQRGGSSVMESWQVV